MCVFLRACTHAVQVALPLITPSTSKSNWKEICVRTCCLALWNVLLIENLRRLRQQAGQQDSPHTLPLYYSPTHHAIAL